MLTTPRLQSWNVAHICIFPSPPQELLRIRYRGGQMWGWVICYFFSRRPKGLNLRNWLVKLTFWVYRSYHAKYWRYIQNDLSTFPPRRSNISFQRHILVLLFSWCCTLKKETFLYGSSQSIFFWGGAVGSFVHDLINLSSLITDCWC